MLFQLNLPPVINLDFFLEYSFRKTAVAVAEVVYAQDINSNRLFLPSLLENRSWSDLPVKDCQVALECLRDCL